MAKPYLCRSLKRLTAERDTRWSAPARRRMIRKALDAWLGDLGHANRLSGHNPDIKGCVHARDFDIRGMNPIEFLARVIGDPRVWYVIHNGRIWSRFNEWKPMPYSGNPHSEHVHVSVMNNMESRRDGTKRAFSKQELVFAETNGSGFGLASLVNPRLLVKIIARLPRRGY